MKRRESDMPEPLDYETPPPQSDKRAFWPRKPTLREAMTFTVLFAVYITWWMLDDRLKAMGWTFPERFLLVAGTWVAAVVALRFAFGSKS